MENVSCHTTFGVQSATNWRGPEFFELVPCRATVLVNPIPWIV